MQLFNKHYDDANGNLVDIATPAPGDKRPASPHIKSNAAAAATSSPVKKKSNISSSPGHGALTTVARVAAATAAAVGVGGNMGIALPPATDRADPSPISVAGLPNPSTDPKPKRSSGPAMIGLVPKTQLLPWLRSPKTWGATYAPKSASKMKSEITTRRTSMLYHFNKAGKTKIPHLWKTMNPPTALPVQIGGRRGLGNRSGCS